MPSRAARVPWFSSTIVSTLVIACGAGRVTTASGVGLPVGLLGWLLGGLLLGDGAAWVLPVEQAVASARTISHLRMGALCPVAHTGDVDPQHAFSDDALGDLDALALAARIRDREVSRREVLEAALAR